MNISISVKNATKKFGEATVLDHVSLDFTQGQVHGIIGRNGSGKSVLLKSICGLLTLTSGSIEVDGKIIGKDIDIPDNIGIIINSPGFLPNYTGYQNLRFLSSIHNKISKQQIIDTLTLVGLDPHSKKHVGKYSLGMKQRLGIAQAIMEDPDILILDEPMNGLDYKGVDDMRKLFLQLKEQGKTILLTSHHAEDIDILCDDVIELVNGKPLLSEHSNQEFFC
ncbi:ABC transporter ATP-binding protein [Anaerosporobacter sp.]|uniref:ABC transporter ATP-binding protein n=1 Tax=Anaerosporobacter sp. TaxID=1872529 RepID=UPI00286F487E|nr:ATP-binding cassette domain-containing protein [Anaerosporobacter sp.]